MTLAAFLVLAAAVIGTALAIIVFANIRAEPPEFVGHRTAARR